MCIYESNRQDNKSFYPILIIGIIGAILTVIGDFLLLGVDYSGAVGTMGRYIVSAEKVSYTRIGLAGFFGYVGIPLTAWAYGVLYSLSANKNGRLCRLYRLSVWGYAVTGGAVHVMCCYIMTGIKKALETGTLEDSILKVILNEQGGFLIPCCLVFFLFFGICIVTMAFLIGKGKTCLPKWMCLFNLLVFKLVFNVIGNFGTSAFLNGLACSNMSLGALIILCVWLVYLHHKKI